MATQSLKDEGDRLTRKRDVELVIKRMTGAFVAAIADLDRRVRVLECEPVDVRADPSEPLPEIPVYEGEDGPIL